MHQVLVYADSLTWGIVPNTRRRLPFHERWPGVMEAVLHDRYTFNKSRIVARSSCLSGLNAPEAELRRHELFDEGVNHAAHMIGWHKVVYYHGETVFLDYVPGLR
jgi:hypothetical protein